MYLRRLASSLPGRLVICAAIALATLQPTYTLSQAASAITFVQVNASDPQSPQTSVAVPYTKAQTAGNLNVVVVGWNDTTSTVSSVTDSSGNSYALAVGPNAAAGCCSQSIYYAKNIKAAAANANSVTVKFNTGAAFPDIRIAEYSGADTNNPVDVSAGASGNNANGSSGSATTTNATDLIFGANTVATGSGTGTGFTRRILTSPDADLVEDKNVTSAGSQSATAPISPGAPWVMQMVAFKTPPTTPPPTAPTNLTATPGNASNTPVALSWTASTSSLGIASYSVERCAGASCSNFATLGTSTTTSFSDTTAAVGSYTYRVRAQDTAGTFGPYSSTATAVVPDTIPPTAPTNLTASVSGSTINLSWSASSDNVGVTGYDVESCSGASCSNFTQIGTTNGTTTTFSNTSLSPGSYSYRVRATDAASNLSNYSSVASATIVNTTPPSAPTNLQASVATYTVNLTWGASSGPNGVANYLVERCQGASCTGFTQIATVPASATSYPDANVLPGSYSYRVRAQDSTGNTSGYSNTASVTVADVTPPSAPTGLTATGNAQTINLLWSASTDNVGVTAYLVERCSGSGCSNFSQIASQPGTTYSDPNLAVGNYSYRVRAQDAAGNLSAYSNIASAASTTGASTLVAAYAFDENTGTTTADQSGNNITGTLQNATWTSSGKYNSALSFNGSNAFVDLGRATPFTNLTGTMTVEAWVFPTNNPVDDGQILSFSNSSSGWQLKTTKDTGPRTFGIAVYGQGATARTQRYSNTQITLNTWYHVAGVYSAGAQTLDIYVNGVLDDGVLRNAVPTVQQLPSNVNVNVGRRGDQNFYFFGTIDDARVYSRALTAAQVQSDMNTPVGQPPNNTPPTAPTNLTATASGSSQIQLGWTASTSPVGIAKYLIERCTGAGCTNFTQIATSTAPGYTDTGLTANTTYTYQVRAQDTGGLIGPYSSPASATTGAPTPPTAPGNLTATAASVSQINLQWGPSSASLGVANYVVQRCQGAGCSNFVTIASPTGTTYSDTGLTASTSYTYQVQAVDTAGTAGPFSNTATTSTLSPAPPTAPSNLTAAASSATQITLNWTASQSSIGLANYVVQRCQGAGCSNFATIASPAAPATSYNDTGLTTGTTYSYQVKAVDTAGNSSSFSNVASATPQNGLVGAWGLNDGFGATVADQSGNGITGTQTGATWTTLGKYGDALNFSGSSSFVDLGNPVALTPGGSMTWEAWVNQSAYPIDDADVISSSDSSAGWQLKGTQDTGPRTFGVEVSGSAGSHTQRYSKTVTSLNTWYHVAGVYNASAQTLDIYVNGVLDNGTLNGAVPSSQVYSNVNTFIGQRSDGFGFIGTIDEVRVYSRALSAAEIQNDMNTPLPAAVASLSPSTLSFGNQNVNTSSNALPVTVTNTGNANLNIAAISFTGSGSGSYTQTNNCGSSVAPNASCTINVTFTPAVGGSNPATLIMTDNASNTHTVSITGTGVGATFSISPKTATLTPILTQQFTTTSQNTVTWSVDGVTGGNSSIGTISAAGLYTPPTTAGQHSITATDSTGSLSVVAYISTYAGTFTRDVSNERIGNNTTETVLTPSNVNQTRFGKVFGYNIDGTADASPLYVANVNIGGTAHNVVYQATEHDSVYAFDADGRQSTPLWQVSFINPAGGVTTVPPCDTGECVDISPEIGITGTPVIDPNTNTLYVVVKTKEVSGGNTQYFHRIHALDLATGAEKFGGPVVIAASKPGTGAGSQGGQVAFQSLHENQRSALLLTSGQLLIPFGGHGDTSPYHGWILSYNPSNLQQNWSFITSPNDNGVRVTGGGQGAGVWQSGDGIAVDPNNGNLFFVTGNGIFDVNTGGPDYGDTLMQLTPNGTVVDYFTPMDQQNMNDYDIDFGSGGVLPLPNQPGPFPHLAIAAGKNGNIYLVNRDNMGKYSSTSNNVVQVLSNVFPHSDKNNGNFKAAIYWNGNMYFSADYDVVKQFPITNGMLSSAPTSQSTWVANYPGATMGLSSNGNAAGILWAIQRFGTDPAGGGTVANGVLHAFDATSLANEVYTSAQAGTRDQLDQTAKWSAPLVANGHVYVASLTRLTVYGLLP
ncbi:MAG: fibronectin type III domain-containing protein [Chloroflexi bacterium]|nr:fibronectin type III domain-containing protein [Chloroflexota bacterium]